MGAARRVPLQGDDGFRLRGSRHDSRRPRHNALVLELDFVVTGPGCAEVMLGVGSERVDHSADDTVDSLGDLTRAVVALGRGGDEAEVAFFATDHEHRWRLRRSGHDGLHLEVLRVDGFADLEPGAHSRVLLSTVTSLTACAAALAGALDRIARSVGIAGYEALWSPHPFPRADRRALERRFGLSRRDSTSSLA